MKQINILNQNIDSRYIDLYRHTYQREKNVNHSVNDLILSIEYSLLMKEVKTITISENDQLIGHCSLIKSKGNDIAYFGYFELVGGKGDFNVLWDRVLDEARKLKINKIIGPINGSIWFPYRFITSSDKSQIFQGELPTKQNYSKYFTSLKGNKKVISYSSSCRTNYNSIIDATEKSVMSFAKSDYNIETVNKVTKEISKEIHVLSETVFKSQSIGYEPFSFKFFLKLYNQNKLKDLYKIYLVRYNNELIGFCSVFIDQSKTLILKTLVVHPDFQNKGIGSYIAYQVHTDAKYDNFKKVIYALVRDNNNIKYFPKKDVSIIRNYSLFEFKI